MASQTHANISPAGPAPAIITLSTISVPFTLLTRSVSNPSLIAPGVILDTRRSSYFKLSCEVEIDIQEHMR